jgi:hypothetical protein
MIQLTSNTNIDCIYVNSVYIYLTAYIDIVFHSGGDLYEETLHERTGRVYIVLRMYLG